METIALIAVGAVCFFAGVLLGVIMTPSAPHLIEHEDSYHPPK